MDTTTATALTAPVPTLTSLACSRKQPLQPSCYGGPILLYKPSLESRRACQTPKAIDRSIELAAPTGTTELHRPTAIEQNTTRSRRGDGFVIPPTDMATATATTTASTLPHYTWDSNPLMVKATDPTLRGLYRFRSMIPPRKKHSTLFLSREFS